jgi:Leucine-rich repeat (LRR) protein
MAKTTIETISTGSSLQRLSKETDANYMSRITHCHLANQNIQRLVFRVLNQENFENCTKLAVLYLYDNAITNVFGLELCVSLTRLYLQNNQIKRLEGFNSLISLQFLNLRGNFIQHVDGIGSLRYLETLHLDKQFLDGQPMVFDEECLEQLSVKFT